MKHPRRIILILLAMFFITQLLGVYVVHLYTPGVKQITDSQGNVQNATLPYGTEPPADLNPQSNLVQIVIAIGIAVALMFVFIKFKAELVLRVWFFVVVSLAIAITLNSFILGFEYSSLIALIVAVPLASFKIFQRNIYVHNLTELLIYPGIAAIFVPLLNVWTVVVLLILISIYDIYAVWHAGFMQKMAKYQIEKLRLFTGFFVPYIGKDQKVKIAKAKAKALKLNIKPKEQKISVPIAILGGGDVVFPIILAGVVLRALGPIQALIITIGATIALALLFYYSEKGKFYPAMPFISAGCFIALAVAYLI